MPTRISVSTMVNLKKDPEAMALNIRRPVPNHIDKYARRGTEFHLWIENYFKSSALLSDDALYPSGPVDEMTEDFPLKELKEKWLASEWANWRETSPSFPEIAMMSPLDRSTVAGPRAGRCRSSTSPTPAAAMSGVTPMTFGRSTSKICDEISESSFKRVFYLATPSRQISRSGSPGPNSRACIARRDSRPPTSSSPNSPAVMTT